MRRGPILALTAGCALAGCADLQDAPRLSPGARYVSMGSSFAAGPGVTQSADTPANACARSSDNYAHQLARQRGLALTDVSCAGVTTAALLGSVGGRPAQLDALTPDTALVTMTIGGNDVGYIGGLTSASCQFVAEPALAAKCGGVSHPTDAAYAKLAAAMTQIAQEVRRRAPKARLVFVDYSAVLPPNGVCAATPLAPAQTDASRAIALRVDQIIADTARQSGADLLAASAITRGHDACAAQPWINGYPPPGETFPAYHPNLTGMTVLATALDRLLGS